MALWEREASPAEGIWHRSGCAGAVPSVPCASLRQKGLCCLSCSPHSSLEARGRQRAGFVLQALLSPKGVCFLSLEALPAGARGECSRSQVLLGRVSCSGLSPALPLQHRWKHCWLIPQAPAFVSGCCAGGVCLGFPIPLGDALGRGRGCARSVWRADCHQPAPGFFMKYRLTSRGQLEVMGSCCLQ